MSSMRKFILIMSVLWLIVGTGLFWAWWTISRSLTPEQVTSHANQVAHELRLPWSLRFHKVQPRFGAEFRLVLKGIEAIDDAGKPVMTGDEAELRVSWALFFTRNPGRIHVSINGVHVGEWSSIMGQMEKWLAERRHDSSQEMSLPAHVVDSIFNLRMNNVEGQWKGVTRRLEKLYLLNVDPNKPTAFEVAFPWSYLLGGAELLGDTKILGEYRVAPEKIDLHYYLKTRLKVKRGASIRLGESSIEGKGFYHPRMGLFSTLTSKDDWLGLVGDLEWTPEHLKVDLPRFALSHELVLDLLPFDALRSGIGPYQSTGILGKFSWLSDDNGTSSNFNFKTKESVTLSRAGETKRLLLQGLWIDDSEIEAKIVLGEDSLFTYGQKGKSAKMHWVPELFLPPIGEPLWLEPHQSLWGLVAIFPWRTLQVDSGPAESYHLERIGDVIKAVAIHPWPEGPRMTVLWDPATKNTQEWLAEFTEMTLEKLFPLIPMESPLVPGFAFTGAMHFKGAKGLSMKLAWKGPPMAILSRSSCRVVMQDTKATSDFLKENYAQQLEISFVSPIFKVEKWTAKDDSSQWDVRGEWSNQPIKCDLQITEKVKGRKPVIHRVDIN